VLLATAHRPPSTIRATIRDTSHALLVLEGTGSAEVTRRVEVMVSAFIGIGVRQVIVDLSAASEVSATLLDSLAAAASELASRGGWLLVEGADCPTQTLMDTFRAYQDAVSPPAASVDVLPMEAAGLG
jgi:anti-anti-sigma regulatory factor